MKKKNLLKANEAEKPSDYEYYDQSQEDKRYKQSIRRNSNTRGIRSESDYESKSGSKCARKFIEIYDE